MKTLIIIDPIKKLNQEWDNSLFLGGELLSRGHEVWCADVPDFWALNNQIFVRAYRLRYDAKKKMQKRFFAGKPKNWNASKFDLILVRKEPPVNEAYLYMTYLLELIENKVKIINRPRGIRNANEKLWTLHFPKWLPETLVTAKTQNIFTNKWPATVVKPLNEKGGRDVFILKPSQRSRMNQMTHNGGKFIMAQKLLSHKGVGEKRIILLNGKFLCAYLKKPKKGEFRGNLDLGAEFLPTHLTAKEKKLIKDISPYLKKEGLDFVGLDVLQEKLLEVNVTCPAGVSEASFLHPRSKLFSAWADFLERSASS